MFKSIVKVSVLCLLTIAATATPVVLRAQDTTNATTNATTNKPPVNPSTRPRPFHGKIKAMDSFAMTITVGTHTYVITSQTKITKDGKPAIFGDGAVGNDVSGYVKKDADGKWNATSINFGMRPKPGAASNTTTNTP